MTPKVSVIIPCFRQGHFLAGAIDSALGQSYPAVEVIVVNDGSDDRTDEVARGYGGRIVYVSQANKGLPGARNSGIAAATGKYLHFLDADDLLHPDAIGWLVEGAVGRDDVLCVMGFRLFEREGGPYQDWFPAGEGVASARLLTENLAPPNSYLSPREAVVACGAFDPALKSCEDWDLWLRLAFAGLRVTPVNRIGAYYRQHRESMSRNKWRMAQTRAEVMYRTLLRAKANPGVIRRLGGDPPRLPQTLAEMVAREHLAAGYHLRQQGCYGQALGQFWQSAWRGRPKLAAVSWVGKLLAHRVLRPFLASR